MAFSCKIIAHSRNPAGIELVTMEVTFPRFILAEFNTHRAFSRNAASSRAIPTATMIQRVQNDPFVPEQWPLNQPGMRASTYVDAQHVRSCERAWRRAVQDAANTAWTLYERGVHKQIVNRVLEPFAWTTVIVTATDWDNFFIQRCSPLAQPEMEKIATMMRGALHASTPRDLCVGGWHLPYIDVGNDEHLDLEDKDFDPLFISTARCARVSRLTHDGKYDPDADFKLYVRMLRASPPHWSPFEHPAYARNDAEHRNSNFAGWIQLRKLFEHEAGIPLIADSTSP